MTEHEHHDEPGALGRDALGPAAPKVEIPRPRCHVALATGACVHTLESYEEIDEALTTASPGDWLEFQILLLTREQPQSQVGIFALALPSKVNQGYTRFKVREEYIANFWDGEQAPDIPA